MFWWPPLGVSTLGMGDGDGVGIWDLGYPLDIPTPWTYSSPWTYPPLGHTHPILLTSDGHQWTYSRFPWTEWQTSVKTLPFTNFVGGRQNISRPEGNSHGAWLIPTWHLHYDVIINPDVVYPNNARPSSKHDKSNMTCQQQKCIIITDICTVDKLRRDFYLIFLPYTLSVSTPNYIIDLFLSA